MSRRVALCLHRDQRVSRLSDYNLFFFTIERGRKSYIVRISCTSFYSFVFPISVPEINYTVGDLFERFIEFSDLFFPRKRESFMSSLDRELQNYNHPVRP